MTGKSAVFSYLKERDCEEKFWEGGRSVATDPGFQEAEWKGRTEAERQRRGKQAAQNRDGTSGRSHRPVIDSKREAKIWEVGGKDMKANGRKSTTKIKLVCGEDLGCPTRESWVQRWGS